MCYDSIMKKWDVVIIIAVALLSLTPLLSTLQGGQTYVTVMQNGTTLYSGPVSRDTVITTPDGHNQIAVEGGRVYMLYADCPDGICKSGDASLSHPLVCLPNGVTVTISGGEEDAPDAYTW